MSHDPYAPYVLQRWQAGIHEAKQLYEEIRAQGFPGTVRIVQRFVQALTDEPASTPLPPPTAAERFSANKTTWLFIRDPKQLTAKEQAELELICQHSATAALCYQLAQQFMSMVRLRRGQQLEAWLSAVEASQLAELRRFAQGLLKDKSAVVVGLTLSYSNGPVEAQVQKRESWSSARCLAVPNFLCYANACSMPPNLEGAHRPERVLLRFVLPLSPCRPPLANANHYEYCQLFVLQSKQAHFFWGRAIVVDF